MLEMIDGTVLAVVEKQPPMQVREEEDHFQWLGAKLVILRVTWIVLKILNVGQIQQIMILGAS